MLDFKNEVARMTKESKNASGEKVSELESLFRFMFDSDSQLGQPNLFLDLKDIFLFCHILRFLIPLS